MKKLFIVLLAISVSCVSHAQYYFYDDHTYESDIITEVGLSTGLMNATTDLGGQVINFHDFKLQGGAYVSFLYRDLLGARLEVVYGKVGADDKNSKNNKYSKLRNLNFASDIQEIDLLAEFHPLTLFYRDGAPKLSPYILAGVGNFSFNPTTKLDGHTLFLQPLHTEGQGFPETGRPNYKLSQINFPLGGGFKYELSKLITVRGEAVYRLLQTDYLDDVSTTYIDPSLFDTYLTPTNAALAKQVAQRTYEILPGTVQPAGARRGNNKKDAYYSINFKVAITLGRSARN